MISQLYKFLVLGAAVASQHGDHQYFVVRSKGEVDMKAVAQELGGTYSGQIGPLKSFHSVGIPKKSSKDVVKHVLELFEKKKATTQFKNIVSIEEDSETAMEKSNAIDKISNVGFKKQWHLHGIPEDKFATKKAVYGNLEIIPVWEKGITGKGVVIAVLDDGVNYKHEDLKGNYNEEGSYDFLKQTPEAGPKEDVDTHGTSVAGIISGSKSGKCGVGIAYDGKFSSIRLVGKGNRPSLEAEALLFKPEINDIYSSSYAPNLFEGAIKPLTEVVDKAMQHGSLHGRKKRGSIYVTAVGNSKHMSINCGHLDRVNSIYTIPVGAVNKNGDDSYTNPCSGVMVVAPSGITDILSTSSTIGQCDEIFGGSSAATPMVSSVIALLLQEKPELTWRQIHISLSDLQK